MQYRKPEIITDRITISDGGRAIEFDGRTYVRQDSVTEGAGTSKRLLIKDWLWQCSACGSRHDYGHLYNFCPNCGRRFEDEGD